MKESYISPSVEIYTLLSDNIILISLSQGKDDDSTDWSKLMPLN